MIRHSLLVGCGNIKNRSYFLSNAFNHGVSKQITKEERIILTFLLMGKCRRRSKI